MEYAIETCDLVKNYGNFIALNKLNLHVPTGKVYGFLGKNGSGKTTTIKVIMGLIRQNKGYVKIGGTDVKFNRKNAVRKIGAIVETPGAYDNLTAIENLSITANMFDVNKYRIEEVLKLVGLHPAGNKRVGEFSLGMRQRLGIANALIHSPSIIILDEPTNGLDPEGIQEMRKIIKNLTKEYGISVLISSHLLSEIEQIADYVGVIQAGQMILETDICEIKNAEQDYVLLETNCMEETANILQKMRFDYSTEKEGMHVFCYKRENMKIGYELMKQGIGIYNLASVPKTLEQRFMDLTGKEGAVGL